MLQNDKAIVSKARVEIEARISKYTMKVLNLYVKIKGSLENL
jgi:hypothetical protein